MNQSTIMVRCYMLKCSLMVHGFIINQMLYFKQSLINNCAAQMITRSNFPGTWGKRVLSFEADVKEGEGVFTQEIAFVEP